MTEESSIFWATTFPGESGELTNDQLEYPVNSQYRPITDFFKLNRIGEGTYGVVYRGVDKVNQDIVAIKKIRKIRDGLSGFREISILRSLNHENVVTLKDVATGESFNHIYLIMEFCENDLASVMDKMDYTFSECQIKCITVQLFAGLAHIHRNSIIHRDIKASNLLLTDNGCVKIADFGLARKLHSNEPATPQVVTLWYRAPELLLQSHIQTPAIDIWAAGCIIGELFLNQPMFRGTTEISQLNLIIDLLGTPNETIWPGFSSFPILYHLTLKDQPYNYIRQTFHWLSPAGHKLLNFLFIYDPARRATAEKALQSSYFQEQPLPWDPKMMPLLSQVHRKYYN